MTRDEIRVYLVSRIARIFPLHIAILLLLLLFYILSSLLQQRLDTHLQTEGLHRLFLTLTLTQVWQDPAQQGIDWNVPTWSISAEMHVYLLFPVLAWGIAKTGPWALFLIAILAFIFYLSIGLDGSLDVVGNGAIIRCFAGFCLGILSFRATHIASQAPSATLSLMQVSALAIIVVTLSASLPDIMVPPAAFLLVWATSTDKGIIPRLLAHRIALRMGELSYSIYLVHVPVIIVLAFFWSRGMAALQITEGLVSRIFWISTVVMIVLACASFLQRTVEVPSRLLLRRLSMTPVIRPRR